MLRISTGLLNGAAMSRTPAATDGKCHRDQSALTKNKKAAARPILSRPQR